MFDDEDFVETVVSPDLTRRLLVVGRRDNQTNIPRYDIWIQRAGGGEPQILIDSRDYEGVDVGGLVYAASHSNPTWSPDGNSIAFDAYRKDGGIIVLDLATERQLNVSGSEGVSYLQQWSPDGAYLMYYNKRPGRALGLCVVKRDASELREVAPRGTNGTWLPDSKGILFCNTKDRSVYRVNVDGSDTRLIISDSIETLWSPGAQYLLCHDYKDKSKLTKLIILDSQFVERGRLEIGGKILSPTWSPDSSCIALGSRMPGVYWNAKLVFIDIPSVTMRTTDVEGTYIGPLTWDDDETGLRFEIHHFPHKGKASTSSVHEVISLDKYGSRQSEPPPPPPIETIAQSVTWAPESKKMAIDLITYVDDEPTEGTITIIDLENDTQFALANDSHGICEHPSWSPDGKRIVCSASDGVDSRIIIIDLHTCDCTVLCDMGTNNSQPKWSPDGGQIAFVGEREDLVARIWVCGVDGRNCRPLSPKKMECANPSWSPDGSSVLFEGTIDEREYNYYVVAVDGSFLHELDTPECAAAAFRHDGLVCLERPMDNSDVMRCITQGGDVDCEFTLSDAAKGIDWSPDCKQFAFIDDGENSHSIMIVDAAHGTATKVNILV